MNNLKIVLFILSLNISLGQLIPGQMSVAGWGESFDNGESNFDINWSKDQQTLILLNGSYNISKNISIDIRYILEKADRKGNAGNPNVGHNYDTYISSSKSKLLGLSYFFNNNIYLSIRRGKEIHDTEYTWYYPGGTGGKNVEEVRIENNALGYRIKLSSFASLDIEYNVWKEPLYQANEHKYIQFLIRMFL